MDHGVRISEILAEAYGQHCCVANFADSYVREKAVQLGFSLGQLTMWLVFLPPANVVCEGYVFTGVCLHRGGFSIAIILGG